MKEVEDCLAWSGARPVDGCSIMPASTQLVPRPRDPPDRARARELARSGAVAGLCPITEANLGDGIFECIRVTSVPAGAIGVCTDSNVSIGVAAELRQLEYAPRDCGSVRGTSALR